MPSLGPVCSVSDRWTHEYGALVDWYWQKKNQCTCFAEKPVSVPLHPKWRMDRPGTEPGPLLWDWAMARYCGLVGATFQWRGISWIAGRQLEFRGELCCVELEFCPVFLYIFYLRLAETKRYALYSLTFILVYDLRRNNWGVLRMLISAQWIVTPEMRGSKSWPAGHMRPSGICRATRGHNCKCCLYTKFSGWFGKLGTHLTVIFYTCIVRPCPQNGCGPLPEKLDAPAWNVQCARVDK